MIQKIACYALFGLLTFPMNIHHQFDLNALYLFPIMKAIVALAFLVVFTSSTVVPHVGPIETHVPLTYKVNLEDPPLVRWKQIMEDFAVPLKRFIEFVDLLPVPKGFYDGVELFAKTKFIYKDFVAEVDALAQLSGNSFDKMFFLNFIYEFTTFKACTGFLVRNSDGKIMHGRNLDLEMWEILSKLFFNIEYYKNGQKLFSVDAVAGSVFVPTGMRYGAFAINADTRKAKNFEDDLISVLEKNGMPTCWLIRKVLEEETTYSGAVKRLKEQRTGGPVYFIVSGVGANEGMVIEKDTDSVHAYYELSDKNWFLIQTNYDRDQPDPVHDPRRIPVEEKTAKRGDKNFNEKELFNEFMSQWPTFNIATIMTAVMVPATNYKNTTIWYGFNPKISEPNLQIQ